MQGRKGGCLPRGLLQGLGDVARHKIIVCLTAFDYNGRRNARSSLHKSGILALRLFDGPEP